MKNKFNIGDIVYVSKPGMIHSTYVDMFKELGFINQVENSLYLADQLHLKTKPWVVWAVTKHPIFKTFIYALQTLDSSQRQLLIQENGIGFGPSSTFTSVEEAIFIMNIELSQE